MLSKDNVTRLAALSTSTIHIKRAHELIADVDWSVAIDSQAHSIRASQFIEALGSPTIYLANAESLHDMHILLRQSTDFDKLLSEFDDVDENGNITEYTNESGIVGMLNYGKSGVLSISAIDASTKKVVCVKSHKTLRMREHGVTASNARFFIRKLDVCKNANATNNVNNQQTLNYDIKQFVQDKIDDIKLASIITGDKIVVCAIRLLKHSNIRDIQAILSHKMFETELQQFLDE